MGGPPLENLSPFLKQIQVIQETYNQAINPLVEKLKTLAFLGRGSDVFSGAEVFFFLPVFRFGMFKDV